MTTCSNSEDAVDRREENRAKALKELQKVKPSLLPEERYKKFRKMGVFEKA